MDGKGLKDKKAQYIEKKKYSPEEYVQLLSLKRMDFLFEGEVRFFILKKKIPFEKNYESKLFFVKFEDALSDAISKISLEPFSAESVKIGKTPKRENDEELQNMIDFAKYRISDKIDESSFVQRKRLYEKDDV